MIVVQSTNGRTFWERDEAHPDGEVFAAGEVVVQAAKTSAVKKAIKDGRLQIVDEITVTDPKRIDATDSAQELAAEAGIDLAGVTGTGADGRIVKADVLTIIDDLQARAAAELALVIDGADEEE